MHIDGKKVIFFLFCFVKPNWIFKKIEFYYIALVLTRILNWFYRERVKQWEAIEPQIIAVPLTSLLWIATKFRPSRQTLPPLT